jgi:hypothetical protein
VSNIKYPNHFKYSNIIVQSVLHGQTNTYSHNKFQIQIKQTSIIDTPEWLIPTIKNIINTHIPVPKASSFKFSLTNEAAVHNMNLLKSHGDCLQQFITASPGTLISPGSEFRPPHILEPLFIHHHNWPKINKILSNGSDWPLLPLNDKERIAKNHEFTSRGNHKSAINYEGELTRIITSEINQGWMIPLPIDYINTLKNGELAPVGIDDKVWTTQEDGTKTIKFRLTHDQSFEASMGSSVNRRTEKEKLHSLFYGGCLSRIIHYIISLRLRYPTTPILGGKSDFKAAYRRVSLHGDTAAKCAIIYKGFALPSLRLTFGGTPCPNEFCLFSEICTDLANDILHCPYWDPSSLCSPHAKKIPDPILLPAETEFKQAKNLDVSIPPDDWGKIDDFIDDGIVIVPDINSNRFRASQALLLAIHVLCRPLAPNEPIPREDCLSLAKLAEEGTLSECLTILGWKFNTRSLTIALPPKKFKLWNADLKVIIAHKKASYKKLEQTLGRLNHAAAACPFMRYFLNRIRRVLVLWNHSNKNKKVERYLSKQVLEDLKLWRLSLLPKIHSGMSLNLVSYRRPSFLCWSDACPTGLGGFDHLGNAWRLAIPPEFQSSVENSNNCLEFIASIITVWQAIKYNHAGDEECFLSLGDNTSSVGWLHRANSDETNNLPLFAAARHYAQILLTSNACLYSQHIPGVTNGIADALSRKNDMTDCELTNFIRFTYLNQVPPSFKICPVHPEICSWVTCWLRICRETKESPKTQKIRKPELGNDGRNTQEVSGLTTISGLPFYQPSNESTSWEPSQLLSEEDNFLSQTRKAWLLQQSKRPWQNWVRSLGQTWGTTPHME